MDKETCFVIQPFDKDRFDKRFDDHFAPAITAAGLEPYRVDRDAGVRIPIESIHKGITQARACLVDITTNNPNVWYELGFALASQKEVVLVCSKERVDPYPFDVRHLTIIGYASGSGSDFVKLEKDITAQLTARLAENANLKTIAEMSPLSEFEGLSPHETAALTILMSHLPYKMKDVVSFKGDMERAGFSAVAASISTTSLMRKGMVSFIEGYDEDDGYPFSGYTIEQKGIDWLLENQDQLMLRTPARPEVPNLDAQNRGSVWVKQS